jgi:hypothetical protein
MTESTTVGGYIQFSEPVQNPDDGYYYQKYRLTDFFGNPTGLGGTLKSWEPNATLGIYVKPALDGYKLGGFSLALGAALFSALRGNYEGFKRGVASAIKQFNNGFQSSFGQWPGTREPWLGTEETFNNGVPPVPFIHEGNPGSIGDGGGIGAWSDNLAAPPPQGSWWDKLVKPSPQDESLTPFPDVPAPSSTAFGAPGSGAAPRSAGEFHALAQGITRFLNGGSKPAGNYPMSAAEAASTSGPLWPDPAAPNISTAVPTRDPSNPAYFSNSTRGPTADTNGSALPLAKRTFPTLRRISGRSQASIFDTGALAVPFAAPPPPPPPHPHPNDVGVPSGLRIAAMGVDPMNPTQAVASSPAGGVFGGPNATAARYLSRWDDAHSPAAVSSASAPAEMFALPGSPKFSDDLANWLAVLARIDRTNAAHAVRSSMEDGRRDSYRADSTQPWFVQGWR